MQFADCEVQAVKAICQQQEQQQKTVGKLFIGPEHTTEETTEDVYFELYVS